jgi:hypothetical protein
MKTKLLGISLCFITLIGFSFVGHTQTKAFPEAEGFGKFATGGRGGKVYAVTNLNDAGSGSFREAFNAYPGEPLTIIFKVGGIINLQSQIKVNRSNFTIAGQTAPGDGVCLTGHSFIINGARTGGNHGNIIVRYLRSRPASNLSTGVYGFDLENCHNVIIDHCSFSWANEECAAMYDMENITVQYSIISEGLFNAGHMKGDRGYGGVWGGQYSSFHHNLFAHLNARSTRFNGARAHDVNALIDYRNNVVYNAGSRNAAAGGAVNIDNAFSRINIVNNYYKPGPATPSDYLFIEADYEADEAKGVGEFHVSGNIMNGDVGKTNDNWSAVSFTKIPEASRDIAKSLTAFSISRPIPVQSASDAYADVLKNAGAILPVRDAVDKRVINETATGTASAIGATSGKAGIIDAPSEVGGFPVYNSATALTDTDGDGMPDNWELANSLNPNDVLDGNSLTGDGYTMLEVYLNSITAVSTNPVNILGFSTSLNQGSVTTSILNWVIANDTGLQNISLERSEDGTAFAEINSQSSKNNTGISEYTYTDNAPLPFLSYYRLKITDNSNNVSYSEVKQLSNPIAQAYWTEPFSTTTVTTISKPATVEKSIQANGEWILYGAQKEARTVSDSNTDNQWQNGSSNPSLKILNGNTTTVSDYTLTEPPYVITPIFSQGISKITFNEIMRNDMSANSIIVFTSKDGGQTWSSTGIGTATKTSKFDLITVKIEDNTINRLKITKPAGVTMNIDNLTIYAPVGVTLPLKLVSFTAKLKTDLSNKVLLEWKTVNELNTLVFEIERRTDGNTFNTIGSIGAKNIDGVHHYVFTDEQLLSGINYYRLKQVDTDGKYTYSNIQAVNNVLPALTLKTYPNPVPKELTIVHPVAVKGAFLTITDILGREKAVIPVKEGAISTLKNIESLTTGIYMISYTNDSKTSFIKIIKE